MNNIISKKAELLKELKEKLVKCNSINDLTIIKNTFINNQIIFKNFVYLGNFICKLFNHISF